MDEAQKSRRTRDLHRISKLFLSPLSNSVDRRNRVAALITLASDYNAFGGLGRYLVGLINQRTTTLLSFQNTISQVQPS